MKIAVVFDTPYQSWGSGDHLRQMDLEIAKWATDEPDVECQIGDALRSKGHDVVLVGVHDDVQPMIDELAKAKPDLVFNGTEGFHDNADLDHLIPAILEAEQHRYTGAGPLGLLVSRDKA